MKSSQSTEKELEEFRSQWKQEVNTRHRQQQSQREHHLHYYDHTAASGQLAHQAESLSLNDTLSLDTAVANEGNEDESTGEDGEERELDTAMAHYIRAIDHERQGQLGKALQYYRQAFRLNRDIDLEYKRHYQTHIAPQQQQQQQQQQEEDHRRSTSHIKDGEDANGNFRHIIPLGVEYEQPVSNKSTWQDPLAHLIHEFCQQDIDYIPALDYKPVLIAKLPNEILLSIFKHLFLHSLSSSAKVALVCKRFFLLTREPSLWRYLCEQAYRPPSMTLTESRPIQLDLVHRYYGGGWYNMFIERPRIRYDGVYISTCHYIRPGTSETSWNQPVHLVTYYRYLRFFTDGRVIKHVTTDEPSEVVKQLNRPFSKRQTFHGRFEWHTENDEDNTKQQRPATVLRIDAQDYSLPQELFFLQLTIKGTHRGRHNKLGWKKYTSINQRRLNERQRQRGSLSLTTGDNDFDSDEDNLSDDEHVYDLKLMKPYFFSPVRSYHVNYPKDGDEVNDD